jgi:hypothetical protein
MHPKKAVPPVLPVEEKVVPDPGDQVPYPREYPPLTFQLVI